VLPMIKALSRLFSFLLAISNLYNTPQSFLSKSVLLIRIVRNRLRVTSATGFVEQLAMISALLRLPASVEGSVVECGCYEGGSTTNLSLAAKLVGRKLYVFDSFRGLPEPKPKDVRHLAMNVGEFHRYAKGSWCGLLDSVKANVAKYGSLKVCTFIEGYFDSTLPNFSEAVAFAFCDVDLRDSLETCLRYLWPLMPSSGVLFTHEAHHLEIASLFYDQALWPDSAPGLVGAGCGLGLSPMKDGSFGSCIGYVIKSRSVVMESIELGTRERYRTHVQSAESC
jgi:O-methyltransferase